MKCKNIPKAVIICMVSNDNKYSNTEYKQYIGMKLIAYQICYNFECCQS